MVNLFSRGRNLNSFNTRRLDSSSSSWHNKTCSFFSLRSFCLWTNTGQIGRYDRGRYCRILFLTHNETHNKNTSPGQFFVVLNRDAWEGVWWWRLRKGRLVFFSRLASHSNNKESGFSLSTFPVMTTFLDFFHFCGSFFVPPQAVPLVFLQFLLLAPQRPDSKGSLAIIFAPKLALKQLRETFFLKEESWTARMARRRTTRIVKSSKYTNLWSQRREGTEGGLECTTSFSYPSYTCTRGSWSPPPSLFVIPLILTYLLWWNCFLLLSSLSSPNPLLLHPASSSSFSHLLITLDHHHLFLWSGKRRRENGQRDVFESGFISERVDDEEKVVRSSSLFNSQTSISTSHALTNVIHTHFLSFQSLPRYSTWKEKIKKWQVRKKTNLSLHHRKKERTSKVQKDAWIQVWLHTWGSTFKNVRQQWIHTAIANLCGSYPLSFFLFHCSICFSLSLSWQESSLLHPHFIPHRFSFLRRILTFWESLHFSRSR